jgi:para-aminobenzoate synthetase/4-amino-4-deoxychorismate lyase
MGVGGGIVADSIPADEHCEALLKASFLTRTHQPFELIETILFDQHYARLPLHLDRLESSAAYFDFVCDRTSVEAQLRAFAHFLDPRQRHRVRLLLAPDGTASITAHPLNPVQLSPSAQDSHPYAHLRTGGSDDASQPNQPSPSAQNPTVTVTLSPHRTNSADPFLRHKTTNRHLYNEELARARAEGFDEVLFLNERDEVTEGAISSLFVEQPAGPTGAGMFLTPPLASGTLPGVMRRHLLETLPNAEERALTLADLKPPNTLWLCNSVRGLRKATLRVPKPSSSTRFVTRNPPQ